MLMHLIYAVVLVVLLFPWLPERLRIRVERHWNSGLISLLNIKVRLSGVVPDLSVQNMMLVANHVSWLDIYILNTVRPARFVSKLEVRSWPIIGWLASQTGTLFIDRTKRHDTSRINGEMADVLSKGGCIAIFPEGTTSNGSLLRPFHASLMQPAIHSRSQVWPAAIRYTHADGSPNMVPAYIDDISFLASLVLILSQHVIYAELKFMPPITAQDKTRRELARAAERAIADSLSLSGYSINEGDVELATV